MVDEVVEVNAAVDCSPFMTNPTTSTSWQCWALLGPPKKYSAAVMCLLMSLGVDRGMHMIMGESESELL